jgi:hypothetical protein
MDQSLSASSFVTAESGEGDHISAKVVPSRRMFAGLFATPAGVGLRESHALSISREVLVTNIGLFRPAAPSILANSSRKLPCLR